MRTLDGSETGVSGPEVSNVARPGESAALDKLPPRHRRSRRVSYLAAIGIGLVAVLAAALLILGGGPRGATDSPPTILYGEDTCARCGMLIDDPRTAAAYRTDSGEARLFDGIDEMVLAYRERRERVSAFYVHDYASGDWLRAEGATFVVGAATGRSMGSSVVATRTEAEARALADKLGGNVATFAALLDGSAVPSGGGHVGH